MKLTAPSSRTLRSGLVRGFTLPELLIAITIFTLLVGGIVASNLWGLRLFQVTRTKMNATAWSRLTMEKLQDDIHGCASLQLGSVTNNLFTGVLDGQLQQGSGLLIYPSSDTNNYILYYINAADHTLRRAATNDSVILANSVVNPQPFSAQGMAGNILTNRANNALIHVVLNIQQPASYLQNADLYKFETSVKQRVVP
jgi:prepilin-type N-terminal cleavage/methylation domain-containing protein